MNKEVAHIESKTESIGMEIVDIDDRRGQSADVALGKHAAPTLPPADKPKVKRKRRSPEKPWKKPKDMPKRPLSAYNLFFKDERERLLSAGSANKEGDSAAKAAVVESPSPGSRKSKQKKVSGIGFANLAKTIAAKWKVLEDDVKAPYEKIAAVEKKKYDEAVAIWREKQKAKEKAKPTIKQIPTSEDSRRSSMREPLAPNLFSSDRSLGSFSDASNPYPSEWFHASHDNESPGQDDQEGQVPSVVLTPPGAASYDRRQYDSSMANSAWSPPRQDHHYYQGRYGTSDPYMRYAPDGRRNTHLNHSLFSQDASTSQAAVPAADAHQYYGQGSDYAMYYQHHNSRRGGEMRVPRASSLPATRHDQDPSQYHYHRQHHQSSRSQYPRDYHQHQQAYYQQMQSQHRSSGESSQHQQQGYIQSSTRGSSQHPRSASMPAMHSSTMEMPAPARHDHHHGRPRESEEDVNDGGYNAESTDVQPTSDAPSHRRNPTIDVEPLPAVTKTDGDVIVESSLHSLTESLDDDAISFITSMKYS